MAIHNDFEVKGTRTDDFERTTWFDEETDPTIPGFYEARTGGGHVFRREWTGTTWLNAINGMSSPVKMSWRGVVPGSQPLGAYLVSVRVHLIAPSESSK